MKIELVDAQDLLAAIVNQRNTALHEAAMNWALCAKHEKRIEELEAQVAKLQHAAPLPHDTLC